MIMTKQLIILFTTISFIATACTQSKQFDSCSEMYNDLKHKNFSDLEKVYGEPIKKDLFSAGNTWNVKWKGVGVNGNDVELQFENTISSWGSEYPSTFKATVECR